MVVFLNSFDYFFVEKTDFQGDAEACKVRWQRLQQLLAAVVETASDDANGTAAERTNGSRRYRPPSLTRAIVLRPCDLYAGNILIILLRNT